MNYKNEMKLSFPSHSQNESFIRVCITAFISEIDPSINEIAEIKTAVSEAVTNAIVHGYRNFVGKIDFQAKITEDNLLIIKIIDHGCGIEDIEKAMEPLYTTAPEEERAGLGFAVMESFMDKITVRSKIGKGTVVTLKKKILGAGEVLHKNSERKS